MKRYLIKLAIIIVAFTLMDYGYSIENYLLNWFIKGVAGGVFMIAGMIDKDD